MQQILVWIIKRAQVMFFLYKEKEEKGKSLLGEGLLRIAKWSEQAKSKGVNHWSQSVSISNERKRFLSIKRKSLKLRKKPKKK